MPLPIEELTPRQIVAELDKYIVGQQAAKRAVAVALRNRYRRQQLPETERDGGGKGPRRRRMGNAFPTGKAASE